MPTYSKLPIEFIRLEYIETTGNQIIDTGVADAIGVTISCDMEVITVRSQYWFGSTQNSSSMMYNGLYSNNVLEFNWLSVSRTASNRCVMTQVLLGNNYLITLNGTLVSKSKGSTAPTGNIYIFGCNNGNRYYGSGLRCYYFKIYNTSGQIIRNFVPCQRRTDGTNGLFDLQNGQFYSYPTALPRDPSFAAGPEIIETPLIVNGDRTENKKIYDTTSSIAIYTAKKFDTETSAGRQYFNGWTQGMYIHQIQAYYKDFTFSRMLTIPYQSNAPYDTVTVYNNGISSFSCTGDSYYLNGFEQESWVSGLTLYTTVRVWRNSNVSFIGGTITLSCTTNYSLEYSSMYHIVQDEYPIVYTNREPFMNPPLLGDPTEAIKAAVQNISSMTVSKSGNDMVINFTPITDPIVLNAIDQGGYNIIRAQLLIHGASQGYLNYKARMSQTNQIRFARSRVPTWATHTHDPVFIRARAWDRNYYGKTWINLTKAQLQAGSVTLTGVYRTGYAAIQDRVPSLGFAGGNSRFNSNGDKEYGTKCVRMTAEIYPPALGPGTTDTFEYERDGYRKIASNIIAYYN